MNPNLRTQFYLEEPLDGPLLKRPLIGIPTGREKSQRFFGLPLYIMNQSYIRAAEMLGALPLMIPLQMSEATLRGIFERLDGLLLPGGEDVDPAHYGGERHPQLGPTDKERDRTELLLTRWALEEGMPLLGICRGVQVINVVCGGALYQDLTSQRGDMNKHDFFPPTFARFRISHRVDIEPDSLLARSLGTAHEVNSMHHQGIAKVGRGLRPVAISEDGLVEALEVPELPFALGVQWHPEELAKTDQLHSSLFHRFVRAAASDWRSQVPADWSQHFRRVCLAEGGEPESPVSAPVRLSMAGALPATPSPNGNGAGLRVKAHIKLRSEGDVTPACF
jgi:putative glutamine amidotransferase